MNQAFYVIRSLIFNLQVFTCATELFQKRASEETIEYAIEYMSKRTLSHTHTAQIHSLFSYWKSSIKILVARDILTKVEDFTNDW